MDHRLPTASVSLRAVPGSQWAVVAGVPVTGGSNRKDMEDRLDVKSRPRGVYAPVSLVSPP